MKRQFKITINAQIIYKRNDQEFYAIMHDAVYAKQRFFVLMDSSGKYETVRLDYNSHTQYIGTAICPDARFIKMLIGWLNSRGSKDSAENIIDKFNQSFTTSD